MKKQKNPAKSAKRPVTSHKKRPATKARPLHKRVLLHPFSVMVLLCVGVLIAGSTFRVWAVTYDVTATVPAPYPSAPAIFTWPSDQQHVSSRPVELGGTCPPQSYVKVYRNGAFSGASPCSASLTFQIQTDLSAGANQLQAKVFNFTDQEGPQSAPVTLFYNPISLPPASPPSEVPTTIGVSKVESSGYQQGGIASSSANPTISGTAPPFSNIVVTFHSDVETCKTQADSAGLWRCTLDHDLPVGRHHVDIVATTAEGKTLVFPTFQIEVLASLVSLVTQAMRAPTLLIGAEYHYQVYRVDQPTTFRVSVGSSQGPYNITTDWGDGTTTSATSADATFTVTHTYGAPNTYIVIIKVTDANGATSTVQLSAVVKARGALPIGVTTTGAGGFSGLVGWIRHWLWIIWPAYISVTLMAISYWIGEQEAYRRAVARRRLGRTAQNKMR